MEKLELKHIQPYPIGGENALRVKFIDSNYKKHHNQNITDTGIIVGLNIWNITNSTLLSIESSSNGLRHSCTLDEIKPILRPMSDLCKPLEDGTYPIAVIGRMYESKGKLYCEDGIYSYGWNTHVCDDYQGYEIGWIEDVGWFGIFYDVYDINNQSENFTGDYIPFNRSISNYLDENHFDWRYGLTNKGLAIDCNELKTNKDGK